MPTLTYRSAVAAAAALLLLAPWSSNAQPDLRQTVGRTVADTPDEHYEFRDERLVSKDGERRYRLRIGVPRVAASAPRPVLYLLDGNAALMEFTPELLARHGRGPDAPVLVFICYDNDLRIDAAARAYDYTPHQTATDAQLDPQGRRSGGADEFLELIEHEVKPRVEAVTPIDRRQQALWGHSYGGTFVLHTLYTRPDSFQSYVAVEPALWWDQGRPFKQTDDVATRPFPASTRLLIVAGTGAEPATQIATTPNAMAAARSHAPANAAAIVASRLQSAVPQVVYSELPGSHGPLLGDSLPLALHFVTGGDRD